MALAFKSPRHTYEDYCKLPDKPRVELFDGEFLLSPAPNTAHARAASRLFRILDAWVNARSLGDVFFAPVDVVLSEHNVVQPDILFISKERAGIITKPNVQGAPDLVIEIVSPHNRTRDTLLKRAFYEKYRVHEYWIVDPEEESITVLSLQSGHFAVKGEYSGKDVLQSGVLAGFRLSVQDIFGVSGT